MSIIAKFHIQSKMKVKVMGAGNSTTYGYHISGFPVHGGSKENDQFFHFTPGGKLELQVLNAAAADQLEPGDEVYVTIEKALPPVS